ncbi:MAG: ATP-binding protein [Spirosomataceae bacterium]
MIFRTSSSSWIQADRQQLEQAIINVVKNALESIDKQGTIIFKTTHLPTQLEIIDSGSGIAPHIADQLFSPFFSTKKMDKV